MKFIPALTLAVFMASCKQKPAYDTVACKKVEQALMVVKNTVDGKAVREERFGAVYLLEIWSGIDSHSMADDVGQGNPTREDYKAWVHWYEINKDKLYWDKKSQTVMVKK